MTKFSKSSLNRSNGNGKLTVRHMLLGVGAVAAILFASNIFSSSPSDSITHNADLKGAESTANNPGLKGAGSVETKEKKQNDLPKQNKDLPPAKPKEVPAWKDDTRDFGKIAAENFHEDADNFVLRDHETYPKEYHFDPKQVYYNKYKRAAQSGAAIEDILMCHAYAFHANATYGGSCGDPHDKMIIHQSLLEALGLHEHLPFACPRDHRKEKDGIHRATLPIEKCRKYNTRIWTPEYVNYLRSLVVLPPKKDDTFTIAVHIRRGIVTPCTVKHEGFYRYLPNLHYMNVIDQYYRPGAKVHVFTQSKSHESMQEFEDKGYEVTTDDELSDIWRSFVTADVVILSRSDFSMIPGLVAQGQVVYTPFWHPPMKEWDVVDMETMLKTDAEIDRLRQSC